MTDDDWPWDQTPHTAALTVRAVLEGDPILYVSHDADDEGWQFLDGRPAEIDVGRAIGMAHILELDPSLRTIADLPPGWIAYRESPSADWVREPHPRA